MDQDMTGHEDERLELMAMLGAPFDPSDIEKKNGRGNFPYVPGHKIINRLNEAAVEWDFRIISTQLIDMTIGGKTKPVFVTHGSLAIPGLGSRDAFGVAVLEDNAGEDVLKGSATDALKKAATLFGVALELYEDGAQRGGNGPARNDPRANGGAYQNQGQNAPRGQQAPSGGDAYGGPPASAKQVSYIEGLIDQTGEDVRNILTGYSVASLNELTVGMAKEAIEILKARAAELDQTR